ncbi:anti-sigma factor [Mammaliicoccus sciuri]
MAKNKKERQLVVQAQNLQETKGNEAYQVWILKGEKPYRAGTFVSSKNSGIVIFDLSDIELDKQDKIAITLEPSPNNQAPEGDIIMAGEKG